MKPKRLARLGSPHFIFRSGTQMNYNHSLLKASSNYPDHPGSRVNAPETSREAADAIAPIASNHREMVLATLKQAAHGLSSEQIADRLGLTRYAVRPRISELY